MSKGANAEYFRFVELAGPIGVTVDEFAKKFGRSIQVAQNWLSRWKKNGYLKYIPHEGYTFDPDRKRVDGKLIAGRAKGSAGKYIIGDKLWTDAVWREEGG